MIYRFIAWLMPITLKAYFRRVIVKGKQNIPSHGPVILVANHPSAFMDGLVIGMCTKRSLHAVAAGEFVGRGLKAWILKNQFLMVPVFRPSNTEGHAAKNEEMFSQCHELLGRGRAVLIFPEGTSVTEKRLRKLKTGAARIALGARELSKAEITIVPVGLNYVNPHRFQSDVFVNIAEPITTKGFSSDMEGVLNLTAEIERRLRETVIHVQYEELDSVIKKVELIMKSRPRTRREQRDMDADLQFRQQLIRSIQGMYEMEPEAIHDLEMRLDAYLEKIKKLGISDRSIATLSPFNTVTERFRLWAGRPLFILGFLFNAIPYYLTIFLFRRLKLFPRDGVPPPQTNVRPVFHGSIAMSVGMIVFIHWYLGWAAICAVLTGLWWIGPLTWVFFYLSGQFTLRYLGWTLLKDQKSRVRRLLGQGTDLYADLIVERRRILESINSMTQEPQTITQ